MKPLNSTHVPKSASTASSNRIRAASVYSQVSYVHMSPSQKKLYDDMLTIQQNFINSETILCERANPPYKLFSYRDIYSNHIVVDGSNDEHRSTLCPHDTTTISRTVQTVSIAKQQMLVPSVIDSHTGLRYEDDDGEIIFCLVPRFRALSETNLLNSQNGIVAEIWNAFTTLEKIQKGTSQRGKMKPVFGPNKYTGSFGWQPKRNGTGISLSYHYKEMSTQVTKIIHDHVLNLEKLMFRYSSTKTSHMLKSAKSITDWPTMGNCEIYSAIACGKNVYLPAHIDDDFSYSVVTILSNKESYKLDDDIAAYFCFPTLGIAVPLRPGDALIFNPREPHCVSSRCNSSDDIICISVYLKSSIVGGNDNYTNLLSSDLVNALQHFKKSRTK